MQTVRCVSKLSVLGVYCVLLAGEKPHDVPVAGENTELHQIPKHAQNLQQELLKRRNEEREEEVHWQFLLNKNCHQLMAEMGFLAKLLFSVRLQYVLFITIPLQSHH